MADVNDADLIQDYADRNSEAAIAELVHRHINLVYSIALRFTGNAAEAQDVTQAVFIILAQKAASLRQRTTLTGWLYETTRLVARQSWRTQNRRQAREQEAYMQSTLNEAGTDGVWPQLAPLLEEGMSRLNENERALLALRFFENKTAVETAALLGIEEWAAHKRVNRAVEKLRKFFTKRGVVLSSVALAGAISANSVQSAPVALAKSITAVAMTKGVAASGSTLALINEALKLMTWTKIKTAIAAGMMLLLAAGTTVIFADEIESAGQKSDLAALQGTWNGRQFYLNPNIPEHRCSLVISGNSYEFQDEADTNAWNKGTFTLREDTNPRQYIAVVGECHLPQFIGKPVMAIYRFENDKLIMTWSAPGKTNAPSAFDVRGAAHMEFKR